MLTELHAQITRAGAVTEGFSGVDVLDAGCDGLLVVFRWQRDPTLYGVLLDASEQFYGGTWDQWVGNAQILLAEELDTGLTRRAERSHRLTAQGMVVELDLGAADRRSRSHWTSSALTSDPPGMWLEADGFDTTVGRAALAQDRLVGWWQLVVNSDHGGPVVGQAVVGRDRNDTSAAVLEVFVVREEVPVEVQRDFVRDLMRCSAEAGAVRLSTRLDAAVLRAVGLTPQPEGGFAISTVDRADPSAAGPRAEPSESG